MLSDSKDQEIVTFCTVYSTFLCVFGSGLSLFGFLFTFVAKDTNLGLTIFAGSAVVSWIATCCCCYCCRIRKIRKNKNQFEKYASNVLKKQSLIDQQNFKCERVLTEMHEIRSAPQTNPSFQLATRVKS